MPARRGFTLLELLMVIAIIILLMGLLLPAIAAAMNVIRVAKTASFMGTLGIGLESFKDNFGYYPPSGAGNLYTNLMGPNEEGWPDGGSWPNGDSAGSSARHIDPFVKADPDMIGGGTFLDAFKPGQTICYWRADRAAEEPIASEIYTPSEDGEYNVNPANAHLWYMVCGDADGEAAPRNQNSYILLSRGKDGEWGYRDSTGNAVDEFPSAEGRCDDIGNFEK